MYIQRLCSILLFFSAEVTPVCFPGESLEKCRASVRSPEDNKTSSGAEPAAALDPELRSSFFYGRSCFGSAGYSGQCSSVSDCGQRDFSYSQSCGFNYICCKSRSNNQVFFSPPSRPRNRISQTQTSVIKRPQYPGCGMAIANFVIGGQEAKKGQFPFMASFFHTLRNENYNFCGGVLITRRHVLTAAHCFAEIKSALYKSKRVDVRVGTVDLSEPEDYLSRADIASVRIHPQYRKKGVGVLNPVNDIAIVELSRNVTSRQVIPVCLPSEARTSRDATVAGWGKTSNNQATENLDKKLRFAKVQEYADCQAKYGLYSNLRVAITKNMLCAGNSVSDTCQGDSGGPLLWVEKRRWTVGGVVSFGPSSCGSSIPGVYTKVEKYLSWIYQNVDGHL